MTSVLSGGVYLEPGHPDELEVRRRHRVANPDRKRLEAFAKRKGWRRPKLPPPWIDGCLLLPPPHPWAGAVAAPRRGPLDDLGLVPTDCRVSPDAPTLTLGLTLRPYQAEALRAWQEAREGIICAPCGSGKTAMGLTAIASTPTPALVLVHTRDLVHQWADRIRSVLGVVPVVCQDGSGPVEGRVVIVTVQTAVTWGFWERFKWGKGFGLVVTDEAHHTPASTWSEVLLSLPGRHRLGLTATPERADGLTPFLSWHLGCTVASIPQEALVGAGVVLAPEVRPVRTGYQAREGDEWTEMLSRLTLDPGRTEIAVRQAAGLARDGRQVLVLTERREHAEAMAEQLVALELQAAAVHGELGVKERASRLHGVASGRIRVLCATQLADEGLDLPSLSGLVLACPQRGHGKLRQRVGRVSRTCEGKRDAVVVDLVDGGWLGRLWRSRERVYRELGCTIRGAA